LGNRGTYIQLQMWNPVTNVEQGAITCVSRRKWVSLALELNRRVTKELS